MQDRYTKIMLGVVAALLAANLVQSAFTNSQNTPGVFLSSANAQNVQENARANATNRNVNYTVRNVKGYPVEGMTGVTPLGDGRSFIATNSKGFMVYQVVPAQ